MTVLETLILNARLQAAAEQAWREATQLHRVTVWKAGRLLAVPLRMMDTASAKISSGTEPSTLSTTPIAYANSEFMVNGSIRIILTAPQFHSDWFWIACRFNLNGHIEYNYTEG